MNEHLVRHEKRIKRDHSNLELHDPKSASKVKLERIMPAPDIHFSFKSPSRAQLQDYESKESTAKPTASSYRPKYNYVLKQEARPASLLELKENEGKKMKREIFEKKHLVLCNRLASKIDRGHEVSEVKQRQVENVLSRDSPSTFKRRGLSHHYQSAMISDL